MHKLPPNLRWQPLHQSRALGHLNHPNIVAVHDFRQAGALLRRVRGTVAGTVSLVLRAKKTRG